MLRVGGDLQNIAVKLGLRAFLTLWVFSNCWEFLNHAMKMTPPLNLPVTMTSANQVTRSKMPLCFGLAHRSGNSPYFPAEKLS